MVLRAGRHHYEPIALGRGVRAWSARQLDALRSPDQAIFYTSGKTSNEAAFRYQLFVRAFGTNNLPDCSNMCHESTSVALAEAIGIGKGSVTLEDVHDAELIVIAGQNPGTNHPRMLTRAGGGQAQRREDHRDQPAARGRTGPVQEPADAARRGRARHRLADLYLPVRINGDLALFQAIGVAAARVGRVDHEFVDPPHRRASTRGPSTLRALDWDAVRPRRPASSARRSSRPPGMFRDSAATVICWAMGITQHRNAVATVKEITNLALLQGNIGKPGAGLCPVRGHSNVQGDRTMGIWERPPTHFLDALRDEFGFEPPREHGFDTVAAIQALRDGRAQVFFGMGGNFVSAAPDTEVTEAAMRSADLTVHVSTKLNRSHVVTGREALILPALGRTEKDITGGREQRVTVEDSMSAVHASQGPLEPASPHLRSEVDIVCSLAEATLARTPRLPWAGFRADYTEIRDRISRVVPGCDGVRREGRPARRVHAAAPAAGLAHLPHRAGPGGLHRQPDRRAPRARGTAAAADAALATTSSTPRSTGSTTATAASRAAVAWSSSTPTTSPRSGCADGDLVDMVSEWSDGVGADRAAVPGGGLRPAPGLRGRVLPRGQPAGAAGLHRGRQQLPDLEVGDHPPRARRSPGQRRHERHRHPRRGRRRQAHGAAEPPRLRDNGTVTNPERDPDEIEGGCGDLDVGVEVLVPREVPLGGPRAMHVRRTLPQRHRSLIGAWCFVDHYGPDEVAATGGMSVAPHPHTGLQTVSWLFTGEIEHRDSAGHHAMVRPGEMNLMTAGRGISHSEVSTPATTALHGVQLWVALPDSDRGTDPGFAHHEPTPVTGEGWQARVFMGTLLGETSPVPTYTPLVGAELLLDAGTTLALDVDPAHEHGVLVDNGVVSTGPAGAATEVKAHELAYVAPGTARLEVAAHGDPARVLLLGGEPFGESIVMWWNFVGRSHDEIVAFREEWQRQVVAADGRPVRDSQRVAPGRFGVVTGDHLPPIPAPALPNARLKERR